MFINSLFKRFVFNALFIFVLFIIHFLLFYNIYISDNIIISFAVHPFNICDKYPDIWQLIKILYILVTLISSLILINILYSSIFREKKSPRKIIAQKHTDLSLHIFNNSNTSITIPESGLYQNFLITGTIGTGKTSSVMYPFTKQLIQYKYNDSANKLGMLILDVKGNYYSQIKKYVSYYNRLDDLIVIEIRSEILSIILLINHI